MSDVIWSALIAGIVSLVTAWFVSRREAIRTAKEFALADQVQAVLTELLTLQEWKLRSFKEICRHVGGMTDDELRLALIRAGALRFHDSQGGELWGLLSRNRDLLKPKRRA